jgi:hypothetical protein
VVLKPLITVANILGSHDCYPDATIGLAIT